MLAPLLHRRRSPSPSRRGASSSLGVRRRNNSVDLLRRQTVSSNCFPLGPPHQRPPSKSAFFARSVGLQLSRARLSGSRSRRLEGGARKQCGRGSLQPSLASPIRRRFLPLGAAGETKSCQSRDESTQPACLKSPHFHLQDQGREGRGRAEGVEGSRARRPPLRAGRADARDRYPGCPTSGCCGGCFLIT